MQRIRGYRACANNKVKKYNVRLRTKVSSKKNNAKRFFSSLKRLGGLLTLISMIISGVKVYDYFTTSDKFLVKNIIINYKDKGYINKILRENDVTVGENIFKVSLNNAYKTINLNPAVCNVKLNRKFPDTIVVSAEDRIPIAYIGREKMYQVDKNYIVTLSEVSKKPNIPVIVGYEVKTDETGKKTKNKNLVVGLKLLEKFKDYNGEKITSVDISNFDSLGVEISDGTSIIFGDGEFEKKMKKVSALFADLAVKGRRAVAVDLRFRNEAAVRFK